MIAPQVGMPVLYFPAQDDILRCSYTGRPLSATIASVNTDQSGRWSANLSVLDAIGENWIRPAVLLLQGSGNQNELHGVDGGFCEFPEWFRRLMGDDKPEPARITAPWPKLIEEPMPASAPAAPTPCSDPRCAVCARLR